jgi:hypothetical protein
MTEAKDLRGRTAGSKATRFKKDGPSPNPGGRPKGSPNRQKTISEVLEMLVPSNIGGKRKKISVKKASLLKLANLALTGDRNAIKDIMQLWKENDDALHADLEAKYPFSDADRKVIEDIYARMQDAKPK